MAGPTDFPNVCGYNMNVVLATIRSVESGDYSNLSHGAGGASGAYQFEPGTWGNFEGYPYAAAAPPAVQDKKAFNNASAILKANHCTLSAVPGHWYDPAIYDSGNWNQVPPGNSVTVAAYISEWMAHFKKFGGNPGAAGGADRSGVGRVRGTPCVNGKCPKGKAAVGSGKNCECLTPSQLAGAASLKASACYVQADLMHFGSLGGVTVCMDKPIAILLMLGGAVLLLSAAIVALAGSRMVGNVVGALGPVGRVAAGVAARVPSRQVAAPVVEIPVRPDVEAGKEETRELRLRHQRARTEAAELRTRDLRERLETVGGAPVDWLYVSGDDVNEDIRGALHDLSADDLSALFEA